MFKSFSMIALSLAATSCLLAACESTNGHHRPHPYNEYDDRANIPTHQRWGRDDETIAHNVRTALRANPAISRNSDIKVQVNNGEVLLTGSVANLEDRVRAMRTVERVQGVRKVTLRFTGQ